MTLRALAEACGLPCPEGSGASGTSLAFAFDAGYLDPFKTLLYSLYMHGSFLDAPIVLYSDDPAVFEDPIVQACTDRPRLLGGDRLDTLYRLAKENVMRKKRAAWNKGTFLKWAVFEPQETERVLFLDVDMIVLRDIEPILGDHVREGLSCCPQFQRNLKVDDDGVPLDQSKVAELLTRLLEGDHFGGHRSRVNSGLMCLSGELCSDAFFNEITAFASRGVEINEQSFFSIYLRTRRSLGTFMPSSLNFQESYLRALPWQVQEQFMSKIGVLHFAGGDKPWKLSPEMGPLPSVSVWHWYDHERKRVLVP